MRRASLPRRRDRSFKTEGGGSRTERERQFESWADSGRPGSLEWRNGAWARLIQGTGGAARSPRPARGSIREPEAGARGRGTLHVNGWHGDDSDRAAVMRRLARGKAVAIAVGVIAIGERRFRGGLAFQAGGVGFGQCGLLWCTHFLQRPGDPSEPAEGRTGGVNLRFRPKDEVSVGRCGEA